VLIRGLNKLVVDMRRDPGFVHDLMSFLGIEVAVPWIKKMIRETGSSMVVMSDAWASPPIVSPKIIREFCLPYVEKVISETSTQQCTVIDTGIWGESRVKDPREILDIKMDMMLSGNNLHFMRPYYLLVWHEDYEKVGIPVIRSYAEERKVCLMLNVQHDILAKGTPEAIAERVRRLIREGAGKGKFAVLINMVSPDTSLENVHTAVAAVKQFGTYPVPDVIDTQPFKKPAFPPFADWVKDNGLPV
jgi:uroporphyrinogen-III decarboxylase